MENEFTNIGLVSFNRLEYTKQAIQSILKTTRSKWKLTVVDNGSTDGTVEYLQKLHNESYIDNLICLESNIGVAKAANIAWLLEPNAGFFVKIDNDIIIKKDCWLFDMINLIKANTSLGLVGYNVENKSYPLIENENGTRLRKTDGNIGGAVVLIPAGTRNLIGYWSEEYGLYGEEDADYSARIRAIGLEHAYMEDEDAMFHLPGGKAAEIDPKTFVARESLENEDFPVYRMWKDNERQKNLIQGGVYIRNLTGYHNKWISIFKPATYANLLVNECNKSIKKNTFSYISDKLINQDVETSYSLILPLIFSEKVKIENSIKILRASLDHCGSLPKKIIISSKTKLEESSIQEILIDYQLVFSYENTCKTRDDLIISAATVCNTNWIMVIEPFLVPPALWARDMFFIANNNKWKLIGGGLIETNGCLDHMGFGINQKDNKYEKLFGLMHLGSKTLENIKAIPTPLFFGIQREVLLSNYKKNNDNNMLKLFHDIIIKELFGIAKIAALKLSEIECTMGDCLMDNESSIDCYTLEMIYANYFSHFFNKKSISQSSHLYGEVDLLFSNAKRLIQSGNLYHGEIIISNIDRIILDKAVFWTSVGGFYFNIQLYDEAEDAYKRVLKLGIKNKEVYQNLGQIMYTSGRYDQSIKYFDSAIEINKDNAE